MKKIHHVILILLSGVLLFACGKSEKQLAAEKLVLAQHIYSEGDTAIALLHLDSIRPLYPGAIQSIVEADQFRRKIYSELLFHAQDELDSAKVVVGELEKRFNKEKGQFDRYTQYIHKRQSFERRWNKSFLQIYLDERGELIMSSNYYGDEWLEHTGVRVYDREIQARTLEVPLDDVNNHRSDFLDTKWEKVTYRGDKENGVMQFIAEHADRNLKAVFLGKRLYFIILEDYDKQAVIDALELSKALKTVIRLEQRVKEFQSKAS